MTTLESTQVKELEERLLDYELGLLDTPEGLEHFKQRIRELFKQQQDRAFLSVERHYLEGEIKKRPSLAVARDMLREAARRGEGGHSDIRHQSIADAILKEHGWSTDD